MKILIVDIYPKKNFRLIKDTNGAYGTGNDFGDGLFTRFLNISLKKSFLANYLLCIYFICSKR